jgi:hypothetical protein
MLMSEPVFERIDEEVRPFGREAKEDLEGLGIVTTYYVDLLQIARELPVRLEPSLFRKIVAWVKMTVKSIPYFLGMKKSCEGFRNMTAVDPTNAKALPGASMIPPTGSSLIPPSLPPSSEESEAPSSE